ncbi:hypothetical protein Ccrd_018506 [Cynara cardunculus var. scolymus]|uniref:EF-hand domain-containing protein n=1 Tax=Cynara cardunculus var. scolymus TaxID=59895 RepID=A0A118K1Q1_CYNCS|nr:hypothetical protein Ccrd_018506 [Cynara cardunculus var. scolymus]
MHQRKLDMEENMYKAFQFFNKDNSGFITRVTEKKNEYLESAGRLKLQEDPLSFSLQIYEIKKRKKKSQN